MRKIGTKIIRAQADDDASVRYEVEVMADTEGKFRIQIPEPLQSQIFKLEEAGFLVTTTVIEDHKRGKGWCWLETKDLGVAERLLNQTALDFISGKEQHMLVIVYKAELVSNFYVSRDGGRICANGCGFEGGDWYKFKSGMGVTPSGSQSVAHYSLGFAAEVFDKITTVRVSGNNTTRYVPPEGQADDSWVTKLNAFVGLCVEPGNGTKEMPYSEQRAEFFYQFMLDLCRATKKLDEFLANDKALLKACDSGVKLLVN